MSFDDDVFAWVRQVPRGKVVTYGQVATFLGSPRAARAVGYALARVKPGVPWQRVINSRGEISPGGRPDRGELQQKMLEREGVSFNAAGQVDLKKYRWPGPG